MLNRYDNCRLGNNLVKKYIKRNGCFNFKEDIK